MNRNFYEHPPLLLEKPNSLTESYEWKPGVHPYAYEIDVFESRLVNTTNYLGELDEHTKTLLPLLTSSVYEPVIVTDDEEFDSMLNVLARERVISLDVKCHSEYYHPYPRFLVISAIVGRQHEYFVDFTLFSMPKIAQLNSIFTNPSIIKVVSKFASKCLYLQWEYSLYFVGLYEISNQHNWKKWIKVSKNRKFNYSQSRISPDAISYAQRKVYAILKIFLRLKKTFESFFKGIEESRHLVKNVKRKMPFVPETRESGLFYKFMWLQRDLMARMKDLNSQKILSNSALFYLSRNYGKFIKDSFGSLRVDPSFKKIGTDLGIKFLEVLSDPEQIRRIEEKWIELPFINVNPKS